LALNTGNWLYFLPFTLLARMDLPESLELRMSADVADAVVLCHQGQALDLSARVTSVRQSDMPALVAHATQLKTGSLVRLAALLGARAAGASPARRKALARFGAALGLGLQMLDDWSGIMVDARRHKGIEDLRLHRPTWPWAWLAQRHDQVRYASLVQEARRVSIDFEAQNLLLRVRAHLDGDDRQSIHEHLQAALRRLERETGGTPAVEELAAEVARLEKAYG
jgi:geranylgeranyl pyrophosphate synthase